MIDIYILKSPPVELISCFINSNVMSTQNIQTSFYLSTYVTWFQSAHKYRPKYGYKKSQIKMKTQIVEGKSNDYVYVYVVTF